MGAAEDVAAEDVAAEDVAAEGAGVDAGVLGGADGGKVDVDGGLLRCCPLFVRSGFSRSDIGKTSSGPNLERAFFSRSGSPSVGCV
jgi:hypothetical protein